MYGTGTYKLQLNWAIGSIHPPGAHLLQLPLYLNQSTVSSSIPEKTRAVCQPTFLERIGAIGRDEGVINRDRLEWLYGVGFA